jgi:hypothetical protein
MEELLSAAAASPPSAPRGGSSWPEAEADLEPAAVDVVNCICTRFRGLAAAASSDCCLMLGHPLPFEGCFCSNISVLLGLAKKVGLFCLFYSFSYNKSAYNIFFFCYEVEKNIFAVFSGLLINICAFMC